MTTIVTLTVDNAQIGNSIPTLVDRDRIKRGVNLRDESLNSSLENRHRKHAL